jgi:hypothetical protein
MVTALDAEYSTETRTGERRRQPMEINFGMAVRRGWVVFAVAVSACQEPTAVESALMASKPDLAAAVRGHGFQSDGMRNDGDYVIVEGDIALSKAGLLSAMSDTTRTATLQPGPARRQWMVDTTVSQTNAASIVVDLSNILSNAAWTAAMRQAMAEWNGIPGSDIYFTEGSPGDITVSLANLGSGVAARADFPLGATRKPGPTLTINSVYNNYTSSQKLDVLAHELGHTVGFRHTNWQYYTCGSYIINEPQYDTGVSGANLVSGTPSTDSQSLMNGCQAGRSYPGFSHYDSVAVMKAYHTLTLTEANVGGHPYLTVRYPRGAISAVVNLETSITQLDDNWATTYSERIESLGSIVSGGSVTDYHPYSFNNCAQNYDWPFEQDKAYYALRVTYPQGSMLASVDAHALDWSDLPGWECWSD